MKKISLILGLAFLLIGACMIYLVKSGVSLRAAPIVSPSPVHEDLENVAYGTVLRLFPDFQSTPYVLFGTLPETAEFKKIRELMKDAFEKQFPGRQVSWIEDIEKATPEDLKNCKAPCWILFPREGASEVAPHPALDAKIRPLGIPYFSMSFLNFKRGEIPTAACLAEKRLSYDCLAPLMAHESERKMPDPTIRYFFVRNYNEIDYFLFLEKK